jgi:hypothetical protein
MCQPKPAFQKPATAEGGKWLHGKGRTSVSACSVNR